MEFIEKGFAILPPKYDTPAARTLVLAIMYQESDLIHRRQLGGGPARGLAQFEIIGVRGVLEHKTTRALAEQLCEDRGITPIAFAVHRELEHDDVLSVAFARLLLWTDPKPLPHLGDIEGAWRYYLGTWRPGQPRREKWDGCYLKAMEYVIGNSPRPGS